jgi:hypothetical protein
MDNAKEMQERLARSQSTGAEISGTSAWLTQVRHGVVDFSNFEASGASKCRVGNGGF